MNFFVTGEAFVYVFKMHLVFFSESSKALIQITLVLEDIVCVMDSMVKLGLSLRSEFEVIYEILSI